jgi:hypothetical protein
MTSSLRFNKLFEENKIIELLLKIFGKCSSSSELESEVKKMASIILLRQYSQISLPFYYFLNSY